MVEILSMKFNEYIGAHHVFGTKLTFHRRDPYLAIEDATEGAQVRASTRKYAQSTRASYLRQS